MNSQLLFNEIVHIQNCFNMYAVSVTAVKDCR